MAIFGSDKQVTAMKSLPLLLAAGLLLPALAVPAQEKAVVEFSANLMREAPDYTAELGDQALMGTLVELLDTSGVWIRIRTPEPYTAWVNALGLVPLDEEGVTDYLAAPKYICTALHSTVYEAPSATSGVVSDLVAGDLLRILYKTRIHTRGRLAGYEENTAVLTKRFVGVVLPSGKTGYVRAEDVDVFYRWAKEKYEAAGGGKEEDLQQGLCETALRMKGVPYMWGGTTPSYVDCSGLVRTVFFLQGILLPRNASQQAFCGEDVPIHAADGGITATALQKGDLLFWGKAAPEDSLRAHGARREDAQAARQAGERVTHVGIYLGDGRFIHSAQVVRIGSLDPADPSYYDRVPIRARRIVGHVDEEGRRIESVFGSGAYFPDR